MALHSTIHRQTGYTPNRLMLGREVIQPAHLLMGHLPEDLHSQEPSDWCLDLANRLSKAHHHARQNLQEAQLRQKRDNDMRLVEHHYNPGDIVYKLDSTTKVGQSSKLRPPWTGPYLVISCNAPLYTIRDQKKEQVLHHDRLKLCKDRDILMWLRRLRHRYFQNEFEVIALDDLNLTQIKYTLLSYFYSRTLLFPLIYFLSEGPVVNTFIIVCVYLNDNYLQTVEGWKMTCTTSASSPTMTHHQRVSRRIG